MHAICKTTERHALPAAECLSPEPSHTAFLSVQKLQALGIEPLLNNSERVPGKAPAAKSARSTAKSSSRQTKLSPLTLWLRPASTSVEPTVREQDIACEVCGGLDDQAGNDILLCDGEECSRG